MSIGRLSRIFFWATAAAAALSLGVTAGSIAWRVAGEDGRIEPSPVLTGATAPPRPELSPILGFRPFGSPDAPASAPTITGETSLGLTLLGVTTAIPASGSRAIIRGGDVPVNSYGIGAQITGAAQLVEVHQTHVVLSVGGKLETLSFLRDARSPSPAGARGPDLRNLIPRAVVPVQGTQTETPEVAIARYRAEIHQNAQAVINRLGLEIVDGGYRVKDGAPPDVLQAGFRPGDVVARVNGKQVGNIDADRRHFDDIAASGRARVELQRDGQLIVMTFPLR
ncbi:MAG: type II secretion system protein N [Hyphomonas sp.]